MFDRDDTTLFCPLYWEKFMKGITADALGLDLPTEIMSNLFCVRIFFFKQVHNIMLVSVTILTQHIMFYAFIIIINVG